MPEPKLLIEGPNNIDMNRAIEVPEFQEIPDIVAVEECIKIMIRSHFRDIGEMSRRASMGDAKDFDVRANIETQLKKIIKLENIWIELQNSYSRFAPAKGLR